MKKVYEIAAGKQSEINLDILKKQNILIYARKKSTLTIFDRNLLVSGNAAVDIIVEDSARVNYVSRNIEGVGGKTRIKANLIGKKSSIDIHMLIIGFGGKQSQNEIEINHLARETHSGFTGYALLQDKSEHVWQIRTVIENGAKKSVATQKINNLLLGVNGIVKNHPALIIRNNDVTCSHAVATGHLDEEQLFYSRARGLSNEQSKSLMARGFVEPFLCLLPKCIEQDLGGKLDYLLQENNA